MATDNPKRPLKRIRKTETVRERTTQSEKKANKPQRLRKVGVNARQPFRTATSFLMKEYYLPLPKNRAGEFLNKRRSATPTYFIEAWKELRQVSWPSRSETTKLTIAVFVFAIGFGLMVAIVDYLLDLLFKKIIL